MVLAAGAYYDVREHRIPNWWIVVSMAAGVLLCCIREGALAGREVLFTAAMGFSLRMFLVSFIGFWLFLCRMIGAGDIKLAALICGYFGMKDGGMAVGLGLAVGAVWSLCKLVEKERRQRRFRYLAGYVREVLCTKEIKAYYCPGKDGYGDTIPLGVCLFLGTVVWMAL